MHQTKEVKVDEGIYRREKVKNYAIEECADVLAELLLKYGREDERLEIDERKLIHTEREGF